VRKLIVLAVVGLLAQLIDGSLGMGYGATSSSLLVLVGLTPLAASASVHFSELGTNLASGVSHWRLRNVDWPVVARIAGPGAVGAFLGATVLATLSTTWAKPIMSIILAMLGIYILVRFVVGIRPQLKKRLTVRFLAPLGLFAGFIDATGGGGWGPVATPALLSGGQLEPRKVVGSVDTAEFAVSGAASLGFLFAIGIRDSLGFCACSASGWTDRRSACCLSHQDRARPPTRCGRRWHDLADQYSYALQRLRCLRFRQDPGLHRDPAGDGSKPLRRRAALQAKGSRAQHPSSY
jgi:uncharacterized membrane protein YfcA